MQQLYAWSGLWRPISLHSLSNRLILICMLIAGLLAGWSYVDIFSGEFRGALIFGLRIGLAVFLSWAIAREFHPDAPWAAFVAVALCSLALWFWPIPDLLLLFCILLYLRLISRSSGVPARLADALLLLGLTGLLLYRGQLLAGALATAAFWVNSRLPEPQIYHRYFALLAALATITLASLKPSIAIPDYLSIKINIMIIALATGFALFARTIKQVHSPADATETTLSHKRLRSAQVICLLVATIFCLWYGDAFFKALSPLWAAFGGTFLYAAFTGRPKEQAQ